MNAILINHIIEMAKTKLSQNGKTTTKDIKDSLRLTSSNNQWYQSDVSSVMRMVYDTGIIDNLSFRDNGIYREYFIQAPIQPKIQSISRTKAVDLIKEASSSFEVRFQKKDGTLREMKCFLKNWRNPMDNLGYLCVIENSSDEKKLDPRRIKFLKIDNQEYEVVI